MPLEVLAIFLACIAILLVMLLFLRSKSGGIGMIMKNRRKYRMLKIYNDRIRYLLRKKYPDTFIAALLPVRDGKKNMLYLYLSWTNFTPAILPLRGVEGIIITEVDSKRKVVQLSGVLRPEELRTILGKEFLSEINEFLEYGLVKVIELSENAKAKLRERAKDGHLPDALSGLSSLSGESVG